MAKHEKNKKDRNVSIKTRMIGIIIPIIAILFIVMIILSYTLSSRIIEKDATALLDSSISYQSTSIAAWLDQNLAAFSAVKQNIEQTHPTDEALQQLLDAYYGYSSNYANGLYVADADGNVMKASESEQTFQDVQNSTWYKEGLTRINMRYTKAYQSDSGENQVSASAIINDGSDNIRILSADVSLQRISIIVNSFVKMDDAAAFLIDPRDGTILAHRDDSLIFTTLDDHSSDKFLSGVAKKIDAEAYDDCEINGNLTSFDTIDGTDWILVSYIPDSIIYSDVNHLRTQMMVLGIIAVILLIILIERVVHILIKPVRNLTETITTMADGDFTVNVNAKGKDEIGRMGSSVENFIISIRSMIRDIQMISQQVSDHSNTTNGLSVDMYDVAKVQADSMRELNNTVDQLAESITDIADNATALAMVVSDTKETSDEVEKYMKQTVSVSEKGKDEMQQVNHAMDTIRHSINKLDASIAKVGKASNEITSIVTVIGSIAEETNLLSLNASIEAARAGEAGKGFAVVASEIGKLAQSSTESVENIVQLIEEITRLVQDTIQQATDSMHNIDVSSEKIDIALNTFDEIFEDIHQTGNLVVKMRNKVNEVDDVANNVAAISQEQAASTEEIHATSENMVEQANTIASSSKSVMTDARDLSESAESLSEQIDKFKI